MTQATTPETQAIWQELGEDLRRFIRRRVSNDHVTDDLLQEVFLRIHRRKESLCHEDRLAAWVYRIARNVIHDYFRENQTVPLGEQDPASNSDEERSCQRAKAGEWLDRLIGQLPEPYQQAVRLSEIEGRPQREIAERLGLSLSGVKSRVQRGRAMLKEILEQCCFFHFDGRGNLMDCDPKSPRSPCGNCE